MPIPRHWQPAAVATYKTVEQLLSNAIPVHSSRSRLPEFETVEKVDFRSRFLRKQYEMNVFSLYYIKY
jgi:hypothetical protein